MKSLAFGVMGPMIRDAAAAARPVECGIEQGRCHLGVVDAFEPAPVRRLLVVRLLPDPVVDGGDPADGLPVLARKEVLARRMLPEGMPFLSSFLKSSMRSWGTQLGSFLYKA